MLFRGIGIVSAVLAAAKGIHSDVLTGLLYFPVYYLELAAVAFGFLVAVSYVVDPDREQEKDSPFYRWVIRVYVEALMMVMGVKTKTEGLEKLPKEGRFLLVCNHQFAADPGILLHYFRHAQLAFISKKENRKLFCVGRLMHKILCQELDREDDRQALRVILKCVKIIREDQASIAVFPEGGTNHDALLHPLKPGVFKIAQKTGVPIVVCTIQGTRNVIRNAIRLKKTRVQLRLVEVLKPETLAGMTTVDIAQRVYDIMARDLGPELVAPAE